MPVSLHVAPYGAVLGLLGALLTINVIINRVRARIDAGDGGVAGLAQAIRAHANFVEQAPMALIIIALAEAAGARTLVIHALGAALLVSRFASAFALSRSLGQTPLRQLGGGTAVLVAVAAALALLLTLLDVR